MLIKLRVIGKIMVIQVGEIYETNNFGTLEVIEYINFSKVRVRFLATGYEKFARATSIRNGAVKDLLVPSVCGIGYLGEGTCKVSANGRSTKVYSTWLGMLVRCYDPKTQIRQPTYVGCSVAKEWQCFQTFATWFNEHYIDGYHLDKDIKVPGNKVYGPDTCMFVSRDENNSASHASTVVFKSPEGERVEVTNIRKFAREHGLQQSNLSALNTGKQKTHKGWTLYKE